MNQFSTFFLSFRRLVLFSLRLGVGTGWQLGGIGFRTSHSELQQLLLVSELKLRVTSLVFERAIEVLKESRRLPNFGAKNKVIDKPILA